MEIKRFKLALALAAAAALMVSCSKSASDQQLTSDIQGKLSADPVTKPANITVAVSNGTVTLGGDVPSSDVELEAMKIANGESGVKSVSDQMKVNAAANGQPPAGYPPPAAPPTAAAPPPSGAPERDRHDHDRERHEGATIPAGTRVSVRMTDSIDSSTNSPGQTFRASLDSPVVAGDRVLLPAGAPCTVTLVNSAEAGRIKGQSALEVKLSSIDYHGRAVPVDTSVYDQAGTARGKQTAERTGVGAAAGAVIGALAGRGKGAAIGAAAGGGAGLGYNFFTHGPRVKIPSETVLTFRLEAPLTL